MDGKIFAVGAGSSLAVSSFLPLCEVRCCFGSARGRYVGSPSPRTLQDCPQTLTDVVNFTKAAYLIDTTDTQRTSNNPWLSSYITAHISGNRAGGRVHGTHENWQYY